MDVVVNLFVQHYLLKYQILQLMRIIGSEWIVENLTSKINIQLSFLIIFQRNLFVQCSCGKNKYFVGVHTIEPVLNCGFYNFFFQVSTETAQRWST